MSAVQRSILEVIQGTFPPGAAVLRAARLRGVAVGVTSVVVLLLGAAYKDSEARHGAAYESYRHKAQTHPG